MNAAEHKKNIYMYATDMENENKNSKNTIVSKESKFSILLLK